MAAASEAPDRARLMQLLADRSYQRREVTLASGRKSDFYFEPIGHKSVYVNTGSSMFI